MKALYEPKNTSATKANEPKTTDATKANEPKPTKAKKWVLVKHFEGEPKDSDLQLTEEDLPEVKDGEVLVKAEYLSVDPYMRPYVRRFPAGITMIGQQVSKVIESKHKDYPVGCHVLNNSGWKTAAVFNPDVAEMRTYKVRGLGSLPLSLTLGALGMPGTTAYFGMELLHPKEGETLLVNGAAGAVGSLVGQIGKIKGLRVVGCAGTDEKCKWLKELGFDYVFNYKTADVNKALKEGAPKGVDCYFDNVGGAFSSTVIQNHMNLFGRVAICGSISGYNDTEANIKTGPYPWPAILSKELKVEGFIVTRFRDRVMEALTQMGTWMAQGKIQAREHMTDGFDSMRSAFYGMLKGENTGKAVVKA